MTLMQLTHRMGFESSEEVARLVHKPYTTLYDWGLKNPDLLRAVIIGAAEIRKNNRDGRGLNHD